MTHDPNNWTPVVPVSAVLTAGVSSCRRCGAAVLVVGWGDDDRDLHDHWHDDVAHQLAQARA